METKELKKALRKEIAQAKKTYSPAELQARSAELLHQLEQHPRFQSAQTVLLYYSLPDGVQTHAFVEQWYPTKRILLPVVKGDELELRMYTGPDSLQTGAFHIEEPVGETFTDYAAIELAIIPGVSFDPAGNRLGRGKGYYDRLLPQLTAYCIGICYRFQSRPHLPTESFDRKMDEVWTENGRLFNEK